MTDESTPACVDHLTAESYRHVSSESQLDYLRPCKLCFGDDHELDDFPAEEMVVSDNQRCREAFHRPLSSGKASRDAHCSEGHRRDLAYQLRDPDVTDVGDIDFDRAFGGSD